MPAAAHSWNQAATALYGWTAAEVLGRSIAEVMPPTRSGAQAAQAMDGLSRGDVAIVDRQDPVAHRNQRAQHKQYLAF